MTKTELKLFKKYVKNYSSKMLLADYYTTGQLISELEIYQAETGMGEKELTTAYVKVSILQKELLKRLYPLVEVKKDSTTGDIGMETNL